MRKWLVALAGLAILASPVAGRAAVATAHGSATMMLSYIHDGSVETFTLVGSR